MVACLFVCLFNNVMMVWIVMEAVLFWRSWITYI